MSEEQEWEKLRRAVNSPEVTSTEWRINTLERRFNVLEMSMVKQLEQLTGAYQHIATTLDRMVEKAEFNPVKNLVYLLAICMATGLVAALFTRLVMR